MKIERLEIKSANLAEQLKFYRDILGVKINVQEEKYFEAEIGYTMVKFVKDANATPYHIAIHIQDKQEKEALEWVKERTAIIKLGEEEIIDFSNWNAMSLYFYDKDENIMEFISRRDFSKSTLAGFNATSMVGVAEVGLATSSIKEKYEILNKECGLEIFDGSFEKFCAIGNHQGLLITIDKNEKDWFPANDAAQASPFIVNFSNKGRKHCLKFEDDTLTTCI